MMWGRLVWTKVKYFQNWTNLLQKFQWKEKNKVRTNLIPTWDEQNQYYIIRIFLDALSFFFEVQGLVACAYSNHVGTRINSGLSASLLISSRRWHWKLGGNGRLYAVLYYGLTVETTGNFEKIDLIYWVKFRRELIHREYANILDQ